MPCRVAMDSFFEWTLTSVDVLIRFPMLQSASPGSEPDDPARSVELELYSPTPVAARDLGR
jgi:hypothetical protein